MQHSIQPESIRGYSRKLLEGNHGFEDPAQWLDYAIKKDFRAIKARPIPQCPDCSGSAAGAIGQYVYYSTLIKLKHCGGCGLIWADASIDPAVLNVHFEVMYKDEAYFEEKRKDIFAQLASIISKSAPLKGSVLDIGGGMGHLMQAVKAGRPDLKLVVQDISKRSTDYASNKFGFETITGAMTELNSADRYDAVVLSDSLYYESELRQAFDLLPKIVKDGGHVVIRVPNKLSWILAAQKFKSKFLKSRLRLQDTLSYFNPEHKYVLSRQYLIQRLKRIGFEAHALPSQALTQRSRLGKAVCRVFYKAACYIHALTGAVISPSIIIVARRAE